MSEGIIQQSQITKRHTTFKHPNRLTLLVSVSLLERDYQLTRNDHIKMFGPVALTYYDPSSCICFHPAAFEQLLLHERTQSVHTLHMKKLSKCVPLFVLLEKKIADISVFSTKLTLCWTIYTCRVSCFNQPVLKIPKNVNFDSAWFSYFIFLFTFIPFLFYFKLT